MAGDHYLQAAFIGRWGTPCNKQLRRRDIVVRRKSPSKTFLTTPENVGKINGLYPEWLEKLWGDTYEADLITAIDRLEHGTITSADASYLMLHVAALKPRNPTFLDYLNDNERERGLPITSDPSKLAAERLLSMVATMPYVQTWRWRVLHPASGECFITNEQGLYEFGDIDPRTGKLWPGHGIFFPLGSTIGILGFRYHKNLHKSTYIFRPLDFSERYTLNPGYANRLNRNLWDESREFIIGRPQDATLVELFGHEPEIRYDPTGPYRFRRFGFFSD